MQPSPLLASVDPRLNFDPEAHLACGDVFVARSMSPLDDSVAALTRGVGMPDRATRGWIECRGPGVAALIDSLDFLALSGRPREIKSGVLAGVSAAVSVYVEGDAAFLDTPRLDAPTVAAALSDRTSARGLEVAVANRTVEVGRIAVMGPDAVPLLASLELSDADAMAVGDTIEIEVIEEPVRICRSDFIGPFGYEIVTSIGVFNMVLAVLCSWAVRLKLRLLPVGLDAVDAVRRVNQIAR